MVDQLNKFLKIPQKDQKNKSIHSSKHALAKELCEYFHEEKDYRKYLGICFRHPEEKIRQIFAEIKSDAERNPKVVPVKLFFWKVRELKKS